MSRKRYKNYLREEDARLPKTSSWRQRNEGNCSSEPNQPIESNAEDVLSVARLGSIDSDITDEDEPSQSIHDACEDSDAEDVLSLAASGSIDSDITDGDIDSSSTHMSCSFDSSLHSFDTDNYENSSLFTESSCDTELEDQCSYMDDNDSNNSFDDNDEDFGFISGGNEPIYEGASLSRSQSLLLLMAFVLRHNLTDNALHDFLSVMNMHFPETVPTSKYLFYKKFSHGAFTQHYFCQDCSHYFGIIGDCDPGDICSCPEAKSVKEAKSHDWYFSYWKIQSQLELLLQDDAFAECIFNRTEHAASGLTDCTDGKIFEHLKDVYGYGPNDISLLWNVDGVQVFKSSSQQLWPIQCTVLELPVEKRKDHIIMPALWFHKNKVDMSLLMLPFAKEIELLSSKGFQFNGRCIRVFAPICTADAPARPKVKNTIQFNGKYGCDWCLHPGKRVISGRGHARAYPYIGPQRERTHQRMEKLAIEALELRSAKRGVKGPSILSYITHFDIVNGFVPDFMHCALLGVARQMNTLWFGSSNHEDDWYIGQPAKQRDYDHMLKGIVPPKEIRRLPRSITAREQWKANEYKTFVLYYSLIILQDVLPRAYLNHYFLFVWSLHILLGTNISHEDLTKVDAVLTYFGLKMEQLYGLKHCTFNVHQLVHLAKSTTMCGPLWAVSTFTFESNNATLRRMVQGTQYVPNQICNTYAVTKTIPLFMKQSIAGNEQVDELLQKLVFGKTTTKSAIQVDDNLVVLSKPKVTTLTNEEMLSIRINFDKEVNKVAYEYSRFIWKGKLYDTASYTRSSKRQNRFIKCSHDGRTVHCHINSLVMLKNCGCNIQHHEQCQCQRQSILFCTPYDVVNNKLFKCNKFNISSFFMSEVTDMPERIICLPLDAILMKCVLVTKGNKVFLIDMPNMVEME